MTLNLKVYEFIKEALDDKTQNVIIRAGRRTGKTYNTFIWIIFELMRNPGTQGLWVDTVQGNLSKYIERYVKPILGDFKETVHIDNQKYIITFLNGSILDMGSAERPENLEGFGYDFYVLNEAGIILKKKGLWDNTIYPMVKNARGKIIGTPKGKTDQNNESGKTKYLELSELSKGDKNFKEYVYTIYDSPEYTPEQIETIKASVPSYIWKQEYMAEFVNVYEGSLLTPADICYYDTISLDDFDVVYMHSDTTHTGKATSDFFCTVVLGESKRDKNFYILDFILEKMDVEQQSRASISLYQKYKEKVRKFTYDEKANQGYGFWIRKLAREEYNLSLPIEELKYPNDKIAHFTPHIPHFKAKRVYFPNSHRSIGIAIDQLLAFPNKDVNDDFVDGLSGVLDNFKKPEQIYFVNG